MKHGTLAIGMLGGCGSSSSDAKNTESSTAAAEKDTATSGTKKLVIGDTTFNPENAEADVNQHNDYSGWACIRYGIGETLVHYSDAMEIEPWLAKSWENVDELTWKLTIQDGVTFSSGRTMDAEAVKQCLEHLLEKGDGTHTD